MERPDVENIQGRNFFVHPGMELSLRIKTTVINSTTNFDQMKFESRQCRRSNTYKEINCIMNKIEDIATSICGCKPQYINTSSNNIPCNTFSTKCYEDSILNGTQDLSIQKTCYPSCKYVMFSLEEKEKTSTEYGAFDLNKFGKEYSDYIEKMMLVTGDFKAWEPKLKRTSMIHINFDEKHFWTVTKDAKMTIPDIIGNIGGTLGVFIGFSFLGLLDTIMEFFQYLMRKKMRLQKQKRRHHRPKSLKA